LKKNIKIWTKYGKYGLKGKILKILIDNLLMASYMYDPENMFSGRFRAYMFSRRFRARKKYVNPYKSHL
jgi:hypothetical protein